MPLVVFILVALVCLGLLGFACACLSDQPALALERALQVPALLPAVILVWALLVLGGFSNALMMLSAVPARGRSSPALLQRFLF